MMSGLFVCIRDDKELILKNKKTVTQIISPNILICGSNANNTPNPVATPLPPENFNHKGKQCPKTEKKPDIAIK